MSQNSGWENFERTRFHVTPVFAERGKAPGNFSFSKTKSSENFDSYKFDIRKLFHLSWILERKLKQYSLLFISHYMYYRTVSSHFAEPVIFYGPFGQSNMHSKYILFLPKTNQGGNEYTTE